MRGEVTAIVLEKEFRFEASHVLPEHGGKCARLHGHSWIGRVIVRGRPSDVLTTGASAGMLVDYGEMKSWIRELLEDRLDHHHLNDTVDPNPTSENVATFVWRWVRERMEAAGLGDLRLGVSIEETCTSRCVAWDLQPLEENPS